MILTFSVDAEQAKALVECYNVLTGEKKIIIEAGKRYRRRDGKVSGKIEKSKKDRYPYEFEDSDNYGTYTAIGELFTGVSDEWDLIEEVPCNS
jgi:hypothetical protein